MTAMLCEIPSTGRAMLNAHFQERTSLIQEVKYLAKMLAALPSSPPCTCPATPTTSKPCETFSISGAIIIASSTTHPPPPKPATHPPPPPSQSRNNILPHIMSSPLTPAQLNVLERVLTQEQRDDLLGYLNASGAVPRSPPRSRSAVRGKGLKGLHTKVRGRKRGANEELERR